MFAWILNKSEKLKAYWAEYCDRTQCHDCESTRRTKEYAEYPGIILCPGCYREREIDEDWEAALGWNEQQKEEAAKRDKAKREADINEIVERVHKRLAEMNKGNL